MSVAVLCWWVTHLDCNVNVTVIVTVPSDPHGSYIFHFVTVLTTHITDIYELIHDLIFVITYKNKNYLD